MHNMNWSIKSVDTLLHNRSTSTRSTSSQAYSRIIPSTLTRCLRERGYSWFFRDRASWEADGTQIHLFWCPFVRYYTHLSTTWTCFKSKALQLPSTPCTLLPITPTPSASDRFHSDSSCIWISLWYPHCWFVRFLIRGLPSFLDFSSPRWSCFHVWCSILQVLRLVYHILLQGCPWHLTSFPPK